MNLAAILLSGWLTLAWLPHGGVALYDKPLPEYIHFGGSFAADIGIEVAWGPLFIGGSVRIPVWKIGNDLSFWPTQLESRFDAGIQLGLVRLGWRHDCYHPVVPFLATIQWNGDQVVPRFDGAYDEIYVRIGGRFGK